MKSSALKVFLQKYHPRKKLQINRNTTKAKSVFNKAAIQLEIYYGKGTEPAAHFQETHSQE